MTDNIPVHVGLLGHIDHGKTSLARALSEHVSTAGLDKHPQSRERGITIDLGFTMFRLGQYLVTLVDAPGHADLIKSVVAGANIIDAAILVVAADEGPKVQTGEHLLILEAMDVRTILVAVSKIDLVSESQTRAVEEKMRSILRDIGMEQTEIVRVSVLKGIGIDVLREKLLHLLKPRVRDTAGPFLIPIDHAFPVRGHGTVVTGTVSRGSVKQGQTVELVPQAESSVVRSIQTFGEERDRAQAGDRVGLNVPELDSREIQRGNYLCEPGTLVQRSALIVAVNLNRLYKGRITPRMVVAATVGMPTITAEIIPIERLQGKWSAVQSLTGEHISTAVLLSERVPVQLGSRVLLMRTDLPPNQVRIVGSGKVIEMPERMLLWKRKQKLGSISRVREYDVLVNGLASRKETATRLMNTEVTTDKGIRGILGEPFGTKGVVSAKFESDVAERDTVVLETLKEVEYSFGQRD